MDEKPYKKIGDTYYPKSKKTKIMENEIEGIWWRAWKEGEEFFYECDAGHFSPKFETMQISEEDFQLAKVGKLTGKDLAQIYQKKR